MYITEYFRFYFVDGILIRVGASKPHLRLNSLVATCFCVWKTTSLFRKLSRSFHVHTYTQTLLLAFKV